MPSNNLIQLRIMKSSQMLRIQCRVRGQQRNNGGGCATMRERPERVESPGIYVTE